MEIIINLILIILVLICISICYSIIIRVSKALKYGSIFLFCALLMMLVRYILSILNLIKDPFSLIRTLFIVPFFIFILIGLYCIRRAIKDVNGEIVANGKIKIKRGGRSIKH